MNIKFVFSDKSTISLPKEKAEAVMSSQKNIVMVYDENDRWSGITINKSYLVKTVKDHDSEIGKPLPEDRQLEPKPVNRDKLIKELNKAKKVLNEKLSS